MQSTSISDAHAIWQAIVRFEGSKIRLRTPLNASPKGNLAFAWYSREKLLGTLFCLTGESEDDALGQLLGVRSAPCVSPSRFFWFDLRLSVLRKPSHHLL